MGTFPYTMGLNGLIGFKIDNEYWPHVLKGRIVNLWVGEKHGLWFSYKLYVLLTLVRDKMLWVSERKCVAKIEYHHVKQREWTEAWMRVGFGIFGGKKRARRFTSQLLLWLPCGSIKRRSRLLRILNKSTHLQRKLCCENSKELKFAIFRNDIYWYSWQNYIALCVRLRISGELCFVIECRSVRSFKQ